MAKNGRNEKKQTPQKRGNSKGASRGHLSSLPKTALSSSRPKKKITPNRTSGFAGGKRPYDYAYYEKEPASPEYMQRLFAERNYEVSERELAAYWKYYSYTFV